MFAKEAEIVNEDFLTTKNIYELYEKNENFNFAQIFDIYRSFYIHNSVEFLNNILNIKKINGKFLPNYGKFLPKS